MIRGGMGAAAWCLVVGVGLQVSSVISLADMVRIRCAVFSVSQIAAAVTAGHKPLLIVNGRESGRIASRPKSCRDTKGLTAGIAEVRFAKPGFAERVYGKKGHDGVVEVQYAVPPGRKG